MSKNIEKLLIKNRVLDNEANKISKVHFDKHAGESLLKISTGGYRNYGFIYIDVSTNEKIEFYYKNILIFSTSQSMQKMISCLFESDAYIKINGFSQTLTLHIYGAEPIIDNKVRLVPILKKIVKNEGSKYVSYTYSSIEDIENNDLAIDMEMHYLKDVQTFQIDHVNYLGYLYFEENLYFNSSVDNYANNIIITNKCSDACIVPDVVNNSVYILYIKDNVLCYKMINSDYVLSEEITIKNTFNDQIVSFAYVTISNYSMPIFAINFANHKMALMIIENNEFKCRLIKKANNIQIFLDNDRLCIFAYENNLVEISEYQIINNESDIAIVSISKSKQIYNVDTAFKIENKYLLFNSNYCTEVSDAELFGY